VSDDRLNQSPASGAHESLLLTADEVAQLLGISTRTLWRLCSAGRCPPPLRIGGNTRWRRAEVECWVAEGCPLWDVLRDSQS
jgi:excisionase family DNA binding protein